MTGRNHSRLLLIAAAAQAAFMVVASGAAGQDRAAAVGGRQELVDAVSEPTFPDSEVARLTAEGLGRFSQADFKGAAEEFTNALKLSPRKGSLYLQRGLAFLELDDFESSLKDLDKAEEMDKQNKLAIHLCKGKAYLGLNRYDEALSEFDSAVSMDPRSPLAYIGRAEAHLVMGADDKSLGDLEVALRLDPDQPHAYFLRAIYFKRQHKKEQAIKDLKKAVELDKSYLSCHEKVPKAGTKRVETGDDLAEMLKLGKGGNRAAQLLGRGLALERAGDHLAAIKEFTDAILDSPDSLEAYKWRASLYLDMSSFDFASKDLTKAIEITPKDPALFASRARANLELGKVAEALDDYTQAIALSDRPHAGLYEARGLVYSRIGESDKAIADFSKSIECDPQKSTAYVDRGLEYLVAKKYTGALDDFSKAIELGEDRPLAYKYRGQAKHHLGDRKGALDDLQKAAALYDAERDLFGSRQIARLIDKLRKTE